MITSLEYNSGLSLEEAQKRYIEVMGEFIRVRLHYTGFFGKFRKNIRRKDKKALADCVGVLLPLSLEASVQDQIKQAKITDETLHNQISNLNRVIMDYLSGFKNTGVTKVQ